MGILLAAALVVLPGGIHGELFSPDAGRHPAVVLLHGGAGLTRRGADFRAYAGELAAQGFVVLLPHYFDATHFETMGTPTREKFSLWQRAVRDAIAWLRARPDVSRVALLGFSLGGFLAVSIADKADAVVEYYAGISDFAAPPAKLPPMLLLHGEADEIVPAHEARRLSALLDKQHAAHELLLYPGAEHAFDTDRSPGSAGEDAWRRAVSFLRSH